MPTSSLARLQALEVEEAEEGVALLEEELQGELQVDQEQGLVGPRALQALAGYPSTSRTHLTS